jgi:hypothetical protein
MLRNTSGTDTWLEAPIIAKGGRFHLTRRTLCSARGVISVCPTDPWLFWNRRSLRRIRACGSALANFICRATRRHRRPVAAFDYRLREAAGAGPLPPWNERPLRHGPLSSGHGALAHTNLTLTLPDPDRGPAGQGFLSLELAPPGSAVMRWSPCPAIVSALEGTMLSGMP